MKRMWGVLAATALFSAALACSAGATAPTPTPASLPFPTQTLAPPEPSTTPTLALEGSPAAFAGTSLVIPKGLATDASGEAVVASSSSNGAPWDVHPPYTQFTLQGYPLEGTSFQPQIFVYPAQAFAQMHEGAAATIVNLQTLLANPDKPLPTQLPFLPPFNAAQVFTAQPQVLQFQNGSGVRYLTEFAQYTATANNHDLFYTFQGLTSDGSSYIVAILPVNATFLAADEKPDSPVPPDGIPFVLGNPQQYYEAVVEKLNNASAESFSPSLTTLDALVQSIRATMQP